MYNRIVEKGRIIVKNGASESLIKRILNSVADAFYPVRCPYCGRVIYREYYACEDCKRKMPDVPTVSRVEGGYRCTAPFMYKDEFSEAVKALKFSGREQYAKPLAFAVVGALQCSGVNLDFDYVACVPMHAVQKRERGYNQSELLARECARFLGTEYIDALEKFKKNKVQHTLSGSERRNNVKGVYRAVDKEKLKGKRILLIDDIVTTGSTLAECSKILNKCGCKEIECAVVCNVG